MVGCRSRLSPSLLSAVCSDALSEHWCVVFNLFRMRCLRDWTGKTSRSLSTLICHLMDVVD